MPPRVRTSGACHACRYDVLDAFAALAGLTLRSPLRPRALPHSSHPTTWAVAASRRFSIRPFLKHSAQAQESEETKRPSSQEDTDQTFSQHATPPSPVHPIPWYLKVDPPTPPAPSNPLFASQVIPALPADAPTILSPIVTYLADTAGLDSISILDLRHLDPPPALGANLIMLIGTARSVKHLNVSADRFARWCRSNYKLRPYADGLLGRNELKLKLRRKARRQKLAQSVGNTVDASRDDGITTGWICVNVGPVDEVVDEDTEQELQVEDPVVDEHDGLHTEDGYIGFGTRSAAPRIVVQMFTEEKRLEVDLEGLWDVRSTRRARKQDKANTATEQHPDTLDVWAESRAQSDAEIESPSARDAVDDSRSTDAIAAS